jgi:hypothetical protein
MLIMNLAGLTNAQVRRMIRARCRRFGRVLGVSIHRRATARPGAFALVDMASVAEVKKVISGIGDVLFGGSALIQLSQHSWFAGAAVVAPAGGPYIPEMARAEAQAKAAIRSWLDTSARYLKQGWRVQSAA